MDVLGNKEATNVLHMIDRIRTSTLDTHNPDGKRTQTVFSKSFLLAVEVNKISLW